MKAQSCTLRKPDDIQEKWYVVNAEGCVVGRLATRIASILRGKKEPAFATHQNPKIHVIVINAEKILFTADKLKTKMYYHHSGWRTGIKAISAEHLLAEKPEEVLRKAIHGMLPSGPLGSCFRKNLRLFRSGEYNGQHDAQKPEVLVLKTRTPKVTL